MLLGFLVDDVLVATRAVFLPFDALRVQALVLHGEIIPVLAITAGHNDFFARHLLSILQTALLL
jgi:hypothetical protein